MPCASACLTYVTSNSEDERRAVSNRIVIGHAHGAADPLVRCVECTVRERVQYQWYASRFRFIRAPSTSGRGSTERISGLPGLNTKSIRNHCSRLSLDATDLQMYPFLLLATPPDPAPPQRADSRRISAQPTEQMHSIAIDCIV